MGERGEEGVRDRGKEREADVVSEKEREREIEGNKKYI